MENFLTILIAFYLGKYNDKIYAWVTKQLFKLKFINNKKKYNDFYDTSFTDADFEEGDH